MKGENSWRAGVAVLWTCHNPKYRDSVTSPSATVIIIRARCDNPQKECLSDSAVAVGSEAEHLPRPEPLQAAVS